MRRWHIPAVFLLLTSALFGAASVGDSEIMAQSEAGLTADFPSSGTPFPLAAGEKYNFEVAPQAMCKGCSSDVRIELFRDTEQIVELDTTFDGDQQGAMTLVAFDFTVPTDDFYQPRFTLLKSTGGERVVWKVTKKPVVPLEGWPLAIGVILFLTVTAWSWASSESELLEELSKLGAGSRIKVFGAPGTIDLVTEYREHGYAPPGIEYELRMDDGSKLYVALDRFEEEGYEHDAVYHLLMVSETLEPHVLAQLQQQGPDVLVRALDEAWRLDENNSGEVLSAIYKVGSVFQSTQDVRVYAVHQMPFPKNPGQRWLEHIDYRDGDTEWVLLRIISPSDIEVIEAVPHESVPDAQLHQLAQMTREARAARDERDARVAGQPPSQQQHAQQQEQWAQKPFGDGNG